METMTSLVFGNRLSATSWAQKLRELTTYADQRDVLDLDLEIDLSTARSADFLILGRLLVLVLALALKGARVSIRMPNSEMLEAEQAYLTQYESLDRPRKAASIRQIAQHRRQRSNCRLFMAQSGFEAALLRQQ